LAGVSSEGNCIYLLLKEKIKGINYSACFNTTLFSHGPDHPLTAGWLLILPVFSFFFKKQNMAVHNNTDKQS